MSNNLGKLYVVATPIGNLEDITLRALRVLREVDYILCEDTRVAGKLLHHYGIADKKLRSYTNHTSIHYTEGIIADIAQGQSIALISDAGTPAIADPGVFLVDVVRQAFAEDTSCVVAVPGPSSLTAFLSVSGMSSKEFVFYSFLPQKKGRQTLLGSIATSTKNAVFFESPHRITKLLEWAQETLPPERRMIVGRELTKLFEEVVEGSPQEVYHYFMSHPEKVRGEFVVGIQSL